MGTSGMFDSGYNNFLFSLQDGELQAHSESILNVVSALETLRVDVLNSS